ncbi:MAG: T9SS type A sorting domain-containing protein [Saprospiraceae bacterium]
MAIAQTLHVGTGYPFETLTEAAAITVPGDTILVHEGTYAGGIFIADLKGTSSAWISIFAAESEIVIFSGGTNAWQFTDAAYLNIRNIIFEHQTGNGVNFDDGGTYITPAHHIKFENCIFRNIDATGNNDLLKLSGLDSFEIRHCIFLNGAEGGSGIDMVGCHDGLIMNNHFEDLGSNSIQAKGGSRNIRIEANLFKHGGDRAVNLGGSTDLPYFRPIDAPYEAAELKVYSNIFIGSQAPMAFVGCIHSEAVNNTIYLPSKWVLRILQETVDPDRFPPCGNNTFRNNIVYLDDQVDVECNIGPNTAPETFTFSNNMWFHAQLPGWQGPVLPVVDHNNKIGEDPFFVNAAEENFSLMAESHARGGALSVNEPEYDYVGIPFLGPRSIGAFQGGIATGIENEIVDINEKIHLWPNPTNDEVHVEFSEQINTPLQIRLIDAMGRVSMKMKLPAGNISFLLDMSAMNSGSYILYITGENISLTKNILTQ